MIALRRRVAASLIKSLVLGDLHLGGRPQTSLFLEKLWSLGEWDVDPLTERTWQDWCSNRGRAAPQKEKLRLLDNLHLRFGAPLWDAEDGFSRLVNGGLFTQMTAPVRKKSNVRSVVIERAKIYVPVSPLHLHLDAIEISGVVEANLGLPPAELRKIGASRIFELLHESWNPRNGRIYQSFSSDWAHRWRLADFEEKKRIRCFAARWQPDMFSRWMQEGAKPLFWRLGVPENLVAEHIYKLLFSLGTQAEFLVEERLDVWVRDSATAALALFALTWGDRYKTFTDITAPEWAYFTAFASIFFDELPMGDVDMQLYAAFAHSGLDWPDSCWSLFECSKKMHFSWLNNLGLSVNDVVGRIGEVRRAEPLMFRFS